MPKRKLSNNEVSLLKTIYFDTINYNKIIISNKHLFSFLLKKYSGIVFGNKIIFTKKSYRDDFSENNSGMFIHEVCHVWQYQNLKYWWFKALKEHIKYKKNVYKYDINEHEKLTDFRYEQQGEIMSDYHYYKTFNKPKTEIYEKVIYSAIQKSKNK